MSVGCGNLEEHKHRWKKKDWVKEDKCKLGELFKYGLRSVLKYFWLIVVDIFNVLASSQSGKCKENKNEIIEGNSKWCAGPRIKCDHNSDFVVGIFIWMLII